jgi:hypothetical protein
VLSEVALEAQLQAQGHRLEDRLAGLFWQGFYLIV